MRAVADQDHPVLERWAGMADAETAVVQDAHLGGWPVCLLGIESRAGAAPRASRPTDGPDTYTAGTLFPRSSKKAARAINAASGNRPLVVLANLSGFDGSPESMRKLQLEYGAEIGRAIVNFAGPIVFCVISRYHGGAFVVFSKALNPNMTVLAVDGSFASVHRRRAGRGRGLRRRGQRGRTAADPRVTELQARLGRRRRRRARPRWPTELAERPRPSVRAEKLGEVAAEFDGVHSIQRAVRGRLGRRDHPRRRSCARRSSRPSTGACGTPDPTPKASRKTIRNVALPRPPFTELSAAPGTRSSAGAQPSGGRQQRGAEPSGGRQQREARPGGGPASPSPPSVRERPRQVAGLRRPGPLTAAAAVVTVR